MFGALLRVLLLDADWFVGIGFLWSAGGDG